jgi:hypothetical protein
MVAPVAPLRAEPTRVVLQNVEPAEAARVVTEALGIPVHVTGGAGKRVTLDLPPAALDQAAPRLAEALDGVCRLKLRVGAGVQGSPPALPDLETPTRLTVTDLPASRVFRLLSRGLHAELALDAELPRRLTLRFNGEPLREALDRTAREAGVRWSLAYEITAPDAPPAPRIVPQPAPAAPKPAVSAPLAVSTALSAAELAHALDDALQQVVRCDPRHREEAVRAFTVRADELLGPLAQLPPSARAERVNTLQPLLRGWTRLYQGLAPDAQRRVAPVTEVLDRYLK